MNEVNVLDCTLRDGGYCNEWRFGKDNARIITAGLVEAGVEVVECGFVSNRVTLDPDITRFPTIDDVGAVIPQNRGGSLFVAMINYGEYDPDELPPCDGSSVDGIRVAFHKKNLGDAIGFCRKVKEKGYLLFVQAMVSLNYSDEEFLALIREVNKLDAYAFYIVDSFGMMKGKDLTRLFYVVEHNLDESTWIGFHSHNNMQLAYSNAQTLVGLQTSRNLIIDSSVFGMGRGAGNLNTELFLGYLNENAGKHYEIRPLLSIIDKVLDGFYRRDYWGYSLPNYISAAHGAHPNYAIYLDGRKTLTVEAMNEIFDMMEEDKKVSFDKAYIEDLYLRYMERNGIWEEHLSEFKAELDGKDVLLVAPGPSSESERVKIKTFAARDDVIAISVNFDYGENIVDYVFLSNLRRYRELPEGKRAKCIVTSNIPSVGTYLQANYKDLTNDVDLIQDNAGLMLVKLLADLGVRRVWLAGMDGYSPHEDENYAAGVESFRAERDGAARKNAAMVAVLREYAARIQIEMLTEPRYLKL